VGTGSGRTTSRTLLRSGTWVLVGAVVLSTALGYSGHQGLTNVGNGVLLLGLLVGIVLLVSGGVLRVVRGPGGR
jgi:hypothetical protein